MDSFFLRQLRENVRTSLWVVPGLAAAGAVLLAKTLPTLESHVAHRGSAWYLFPGQAESARVLLSTIASSMMTFTGLVFSITILVLQLASSQFSPRVLRTFLGDRSTRRAMACFIGTFVYAMALLPEVRGADATGGERVPAFSVFFAFVLVLLSVAVFIQYIHGMAHSIRAVHVLHRVADEAFASLDQLYPEHAASEPQATLSPPNEPPGQVISNDVTGGVLAAVDDRALLALAIEADVVIELVPSLGDFVVRGGALVRVWGASHLDARRVREHIAIAEERTPQQDPAFAFRQLVDVAERALSPGINDPTTAVQAIDRIHDLLTTLAPRRFPSPARVDAAGRLRLFLPRPDWDALVHLAFDEIRQYGAGSIQVVRRLRAALDDLRAICAPERCAVLDLEQGELDLAVRAFASASDRARAREPSSQGQGQSSGSRLRFGPASVAGPR
jgi:uncharacterized membrane protein